MNFLQLLVLALILSFTPKVLSARTFYVTQSGNSGDGSLRHAIELAANSPGEDIIEFEIGSGIQYLELTQPLYVPSGVFIDGMSQPGYDGLPLIHFIGSGYIHIENVEEVVVESLDLSETSSKYAIWMKNVENCSVFHSNLSGHEYGIYSESKSVDCHFVGNRFYGCSYGLYVQGFHEGLLATNNDFESIAQMGIFSSEKNQIVMDENDFHAMDGIGEKVVSVKMETIAKKPVYSATVYDHKIKGCHAYVNRQDNAGLFKLVVSGSNQLNFDFLVVHSSGVVMEAGSLMSNQLEGVKFLVPKGHYKVFVKNEAEVIIIEFDH